ncbi:MAG: amidohydrolase family protein [Gammaproteobacteria bacterium]|nr:amidohydrolase family protein [Gammaproteobacteria bacterium]
MPESRYRTAPLAFVTALAVAALSACSPAKEPAADRTAAAAEPADLVITGARVWTGNADQPWAEAVAILGERILAVGTAADLEALVGPDAEVIAAGGSMLVPGFIDTHVHLVDGGSALASVQLRDARTPEEFSRRIGEFAAGIEPGEWITGGTWDHENWGGELPRREWIDELTPDNPVFIQRLDGHMVLTNSLALNLAGVDADTPDVSGGEIVRNADGSPTGVLKDNAMDLVIAAIPPSGEAKLDREVQAAMHYFAGNGVTTVHDMAGFESLAAYRRAQARGGMITRIYSVVPLAQWERLRDELQANGRGDEWLRIGGLRASWTARWAPIPPPSSSRLLTRPVNPDS